MTPHEFMRWLETALDEATADYTGTATYHLQRIKDKLATVEIHPLDRASYANAVSRTSAGALDTMGHTIKFDCQHARTAVAKFSSDAEAFLSGFVAVPIDPLRAAEAGVLPIGIQLTTDTADNCTLTTYGGSVTAPQIIPELSGPIFAATRSQDQAEAQA